MRLKPGVSLEGMSWRMWHACIIAEPLFLKHGSELVITSTKEKAPGRLANSLHYKGLAVDFRIWHVKKLKELAEKLRKALGRGYDVVIKKNHLHVEYDNADG